MDKAIQVIVTLFTLAGGLAGLVALFYVKPTRKKIEAETQQAGAEASEIVAKSAMILLQPLQARIFQLEAEIQTLKVILGQERLSSQEERRMSQDVIRDLTAQVALRDARIYRLTGSGGGEITNGTQPH